MLVGLEPLLAEVVITQSTRRAPSMPDDLGALAADIFGDDRVDVEHGAADAIEAAVTAAEDPRRPRRCRGSRHRLGHGGRRGARAAAPSALNGETAAMRVIAASVLAFEAIDRAAGDSRRRDPLGGVDARRRRSSAASLAVLCLLVAGSLSTSVGVPRRLGGSGTGPR